ncbi:MAG: 30S ribosomal protein S8 [Phycisphaerales bacterium]|nr:30S ribosomal protein S8 [Phycisphaerales bacterium]MCI0632100.1 30S ribosomal protein S8 [Phycisphaerales bacterium]MCI0676793.1 30S ribosomal protein S8 [Phycisphaerales bacterium]
MAQQDLTADMLTRIRNAARNNAKTVKVLNNKLNRGVAQVLRDEGYITSYDVVDDGRQGLINIKFKYGERGERLINQIDRVSKPGRRVYQKVTELPRPLQGLGIAIVSTSSGVLSDRQARQKQVGGEVVAVVT